MPENGDKPGKTGNAGEISQDEVDALLNKSGAVSSGQKENFPSEPPPQPAPDETEIDSLLAQAAAPPPQAPPAQPQERGFSFENLESEAVSAEKPNIDILKDVGLNVRVELGRRKMYIEDILKLAKGSVVELDKLAGDPLDILVNDKLVAQGEVLVLNENFCIRITRIFSPEEKED